MNSLKKFFFGLTLLTVFQAFNILTANGQDSQQYNFSTIRINGLELDRFDYNGKIRIRVGDHISKIREMDLYCD